MNDSTIERLRALGSERRARVAGAANREEWREAMRNSITFPVTWGSCWKQAVEYAVEDLDAETGFYAEVLGMKTMILDADRSMFCDNDGAFCITAIAPTDERPAMPAGSLSIELMIENIVETAREFEARGAEFDEFPREEGPGSPLYTGVLRTPGGVCLRLWSLVPQETAAPEAETAAS